MRREMGAKRKKKKTVLGGEVSKLCLWLSLPEKVCVGQT